MRSLALALAASLLAAPPLHAGTLVLDPMTSEFPPNACLPVTKQPILFIGQLCDGAACPPDAWAYGEGEGCASVAQASLAGVPSPVRNAVFIGGGGPEHASLRVVPAAARIMFTSDDSSGVDGFALDYYDPAGQWSRDLSGLVNESFAAEGDISPARPLRVYASLFGPAASSSPMASHTFFVTAPGPVTLPFAGFDRDPGFDLSAVAEIDFDFGECFAGQCSGLGPRSFAIGPISLVTEGTTPTARHSWGSIKSRYR